MKSVGYLLESASILQSIEKSDVGSLNKAIENISSVVKKAIASKNIESLAIFSRGLNKISSVVDLTKKITSGEVASLFDALGSLKASAKSLDDIYNVVEGIQSFSKPVHGPIVVVSELKNEKSGVSFRVSNVMGAALNEKVTLQSVYKGSNPDDSILPKGPMRLESQNGVDYQVKNLKLGDSGVFNFDITVGKDSVTRSLKLAAVDLKIRDFQLTLGRYSRSAVEYPSTLEEVLAIDVEANSRVGVSFTLAGVTPHQVFLRIGNSDREAIFNIKLQYQPLYNLDVSLEKVIGNSLKYQSGEYKVQILIGDATMKTPISWTVATVTLNFNKKYELTEEEALFETRPLISHIFRQPEKRAGAEIASMFCIVCLGVFAIYLIGTLTVGFNFRGCPGGLSGLFAPIFVALLAALVGILVMYFISWNIFDTLNYLGIVGLAAALIGSKVLRGVAQKRTSQ